MTMELKWVLRLTEGPLRGRNWCGLGNPTSQKAEDAVGYPTLTEARKQARYIQKNHDMGRLLPVTRKSSV